MSEKVHQVIFVNKVNVTGIQFQQAGDNGPAHTLGPPVLVHRQAGHLAKSRVWPQPSTTQNAAALTFGDHELAWLQSIVIATYLRHQSFDGGHVVSKGLSNLPHRME
jgi:hypothetical protein